MNSFRYIALLLSLTLFTGCIHKSGTITPWERATTDSALFAQIDNTIEQGAEAVALSGIVSKEAVAPVIGWTGQVATAHQQLTAILAKGSSVSAGDYASIQNLLSQIQSSGTALVASGSFGIKNPKSQQTIAADIQALVNLAIAVLADISALQSNPVHASLPVAPAIQPWCKVDANGYLDTTNCTPSLFVSGGTK